MEVISAELVPGDVDIIVGNFIGMLKNKGLTDIAKRIEEAYLEDNGWKMIIDSSRFKGKGFRGVCLKGKKTILIAKPKPAVIAHELTHLIGGNEIDAETLENYLYTSTNGATPPDDMYDAWQFDILPGPYVVSKELSKQIVGV